MAMATTATMAMTGTRRLLARALNGRALVARGKSGTLSAVVSDAARAMSSAAREDGLPRHIKFRMPDLDFRVRARGRRCFR